MSKNTVFLVQLPGFEYNDEGFYANESMDTFAVCSTEEVAKRWILENGWKELYYVAEDPYDYLVDEILACIDDPELDAYELHGREFSDEEQRKILKRFFKIKEQAVLS